MSAKTIVMIVLTALVTVILMKNTDEVNFWIFGDAEIPKLAILGVMFAIGLVVGYLIGRPKRRVALEDSEETSSSTLSDEDREYIR